ncbi:MAG: hypothetical protein KA198_04835 [Chitinophagaceae bacterium]|nr:hypothetical protein [Chitinophagaceae bacterium]
MKRILLILFVVLSAQISQAQMHQKGSSCMQVGYGYPSAMQLMGSFFKFAESNITVEDDPAYQSSFSYKGFGPLHFRFDYMIGGRVGIGLSSNYELGNFKFSNTFTDFDENIISSEAKFKLSSINVLARCNIHFIKEPTKIDIYYGLGVGYARTRAKLEETLTGSNIDPLDQKEIDETNKEFNDFLNDVFKTVPVAFESVFGIKAPFGQNAGMYFEVGYSKAFCQLGFYVGLGGPKGYNRNKWQWF